MKNILITGGAGFVGSNLSIKLKAKFPNYHFFAIDNLKRRGSEINIDRIKQAGIEFIHGDVRNKEDLDAFEHLDFVIDASADPSVLGGINSPVYPLLANNLIGTINVLELADRFKAAFIFLSTSRVYPITALERCNFEELPTRYQWTDNQELSGVSSKGVSEVCITTQGSRSFYGTSKLASELLVEEYHTFKNLRMVINRCGVISGPWQMGKIDQGVLVLWLSKHYFKGNLNYIGYSGSGKQTRDVLHVDDLVDLVAIEIENIDTVNGQTFNVGGGNASSVSLLELTQLCEEITGNKLNIGKVSENRSADIRIYITDNSKVNATTQWFPKRNVNQVLNDTFNWIREHENALKKILT